jgi:hypothetical protein
MPVNIVFTLSQRQHIQYQTVTRRHLEDAEALGPALLILIRTQLPSDVYNMRRSLP